MEENKRFLLEIQPKTEREKNLKIAMAEIYVSSPFLTDARKKELLKELA